MPRLCAGADTRILRYIRTADEERQYPDPPMGTVHQLEFDAGTNVALAVDLAQSTDAYRLSGSTLTKSGITQVIAADGEEAQFRKQAETILGEMSTWLALPNPTNAQNLTNLRNVTRAVRVLIRRELQRA